MRSKILYSKNLHCKSADFFVSNIKKDIFICIYQKKTVILRAKLKSHTAYGIKQPIGGNKIHVSSRDAKPEKTSAKRCADILKY